MTFIPSNPAAEIDEAIVNDGFYPDLSTAALRTRTGLGDIFGAERVAATLRAAMIEVNASIAAWKAEQTAATLADVPAADYGGVSEKVTLYEMAVYARARAVLLETSRDYDSTKSGHDKADALEETAADWFRQSAEALARLTGRPRMVVELI